MHRFCSIFDYLTISNYLINHYKLITQDSIWIKIISSYYISFYSFPDNNAQENSISIIKFSGKKSCWIFSITWSFLIVQIFTSLNKVAAVDYAKICFCVPIKSNLMSSWRLMREYLISKKFVLCKTRIPFSVHEAQQIRHEVTHTKDLKKVYFYLSVDYAQ